MALELEGYLPSVDHQNDTSSSELYRERSVSEQPIEP